MNRQQEPLKSVVVEREFNHPPEKVWRAITQPHLIADWLMANDFSPAIGHRFNLHTNWGGVLDCEVLAIEPHHTLVYTWNFEHDDPAYALRSTVTFTLKDTGSGTLLRMEQAGFRPTQKQALGGSRAGWQEFLARLDQVLALAS